MRKRRPKVYRNLALLTEIGEIKKLSFDGTSERYDAETSPHCHFRCRNCGKVIDVEVDGVLEDILSHAKVPGQIDEQITVFIGTCEQCMDKY